MKRIFQKLKVLAIAHKIIAATILVAVVGAIYGIYSAMTVGTAQAKYVLVTVEKGTIVSSVSGSGQVAVSRQIDIKSKVSGDVTYVAVNDGQEVAAGQLLAVVDPTDAQKAVRDAETNLAKAQLDLQKLQGDETSAGTFRGAVDKATSDLDKVYTDILSKLSSVFFDYPMVLNDLDNILFSDSIAGSKSWNAAYYADQVRNFTDLSEKYKDRTIADMETAKSSYDKSAIEYKNISLSSSKTALDQMIQSAYATSKLLAIAVKDATDLIQLYRDQLKANNTAPNVISETHLATLAADTVKVSAYLSQLNSLEDSIQDQKEAVFNANISIADQKIKVRQAEDTLADAKTNLANYYIRAPFAGVITKVNVKKYDTVSGTVATLITKEKIAQLSLNEVDAVKVKVGQKATLTFDAIENFSIVGEVADVDVAGTVSQGVVTYAVKIAFTSDNDQIKPGMSVSAVIITDAKSNVLMVPISAVKNRGENSIVAMVDEQIPPTTANLQGIILPTPPRQQIVETGLANDNMVEISSGLKEGDQIVARVITATAKTATTQSNGLFQIGTGGRGGAAGSRLGGGSFGR